jgi:type I restriction enzyme R subunit
MPQSTTLQVTTTSRVSGLSQHVPGRVPGDPKEKDADKGSILDDIVFEIESIKHVEVTVDYILMLVERLRAESGDGEDRTLDTYLEIQRVINSSNALRNKRDLILAFVDDMSTSPDVHADWRNFIEVRWAAELARIVEEETLNPDEAQAFIDNAFRDGSVPTTGTAITKVLPPTPLFVEGSDRIARKIRVLEKLQAFFERFSGMVNTASTGLN